VNQEPIISRGLDCQKVLLAWKYAKVYAIYIFLVVAIMAVMLFDQLDKVVMSYLFGTIEILCIAIISFSQYYKVRLKQEQKLTLSIFLFLMFHVTIASLLASSLFIYDVNSPSIFHVSSLLLIIVLVTIGNHSFAVGAIIFYTPIALASLIWLLVYQPVEYKEVSYIVSIAWLLLSIGLIKYNRQYNIMHSMIFDNINLTTTLVNVSDEYHVEKIRFKESLNQSERRFQNLVEVSPESVLVFNEDGIVVYANNSAVEQFQYEQTEILGIYLDLLVPGIYSRQNDFLYKHVQDAMRHDMEARNDVTCLRKDGSEFLADIHIILVDVNEVQHVYMYIRDTSPQKYIDAVINEMKISKQSVKKLEEEKERVKLYLDNLNVVVLVFDEKGKTQAYNSKVHQYIDVDKEVTDALMHDLFKKNDDTSVLRYIKNIFRLGTSGKDFYIKKYVDKYACVKYIEWTITVAKDVNKSTVIIASGIDVTERKQIESIISDISGSMERSRTNSLLDSILKSLSITLHADYSYIATISNVHEKTIETISYAENGEIKDNIHVLASGEAWDRMRKSGIQCILDCTVAESSYQALMQPFNAKAYISIPLKDGNGILLGILALYYKASKVSMNFEMSICQVYSIIVSAELERLNYNHERDIINRQLQQSQKMESIGQLTGGIAHDFNNMLASMIGFSELGMMLVAKDDTKLKSYLKNILETGGQAKELIAQMLTFSRQVPGVMKELEIESIVDESVRMVRPMLPSSIELDISISENLHNVVGDKVLLSQAILNLIINARDAIGEKGSIVINCYYQTSISGVCSSCLKPIPIPMLVVSVKDDGEGIRYDNLEKIFEPFVTNKDIGKGTGMGLAMVHGIVHEHNGHVQVVTEPNIGTEIKLLLPVIPRSSKSDSNMDGNSNMKTGNGNGKHIMVVDDESMVANLLNEILSLNDYSVDVFNDSKEALDAFSKAPNKYDLILTDYTMPGMTGAELSKCLLDINKDIPIILCTGYSEYIDEEKAKEMGISAYLNKPISQAELINTIYMLTKE